MVKPKSVHILTTNCEFPTNNHLYNAFTTLDYEVTFVDPYSHTYRLELPEDYEIPELVINRCGGLKFDDIDIVLCLLYQQRGAFVINPPQTVPIFRNKDQQLLHLKAYNLPLIPTVIQRSKYFDENLMSYLEGQIQSGTNKNKYILKNIRGQGGKGVIRINGRESLEDIVQTRFLMGDQRYLLQPFYPVKKEYRLFYADDQPICALEKTAEQANQKLNLANAHFNQIELEELPSEIKKHQSTMGKLPLFFYSVDWILTDTDQYFLLETNTFPGIDGLRDRHDLAANIIVNSRKYIKT